MNVLAFTCPLFPDRGICNRIRGEHTGRRRASLYHSLPNRLLSCKGDLAAAVSDCEPSISQNVVRDFAQIVVILDGLIGNHLKYSSAIVAASSLRP